MNNIRDLSMKREFYHNCQVNDPSNTKHYMFKHDKTLSEKDVTLNKIRKEISKSMKRVNGLFSRRSFNNDQRLPNTKRNRDRIKQRMRNHGFPASEIKSRIEYATRVINGRSYLVSMRYFIRPNSQSFNESCLPYLFSSRCIITPPGTSVILDLKHGSR